MLNSYVNLKDRYRECDSVYLSTNHDIKTKHAPAVLVSIYKTVQKELWFIKAGRFSLFYKYGERKINVHVCFLFLVAPVSLCLSFLHLYTGLIVYMSVHPSPLHVCVCMWLWNIYLSIHTSILATTPVLLLGAFIPRSWLISSGLEGLWKPPVYRPCCPLKSATDSH